MRPRRRPSPLALLGLLAVAVVAPRLAAAEAPGRIQFNAVLCKSIKNDRPVEPTTKFTKDAAAIWGMWQSAEIKRGATVRTVWIAEDVGKAAPANTQITEAAVVVDDKALGARQADGYHGSFNLTRPTAGWPLGKYRVDLFVDGKLLRAIRFTVQ